MASVSGKRNNGIRLCVLGGMLLNLGLSSIARSQQEPEHYRTVRALGPAGYWPADEGQGQVLHDRSGNDNHGRIYHVPWEHGLLNFTSSAYNWVEIPHDERYGSESFTAGGWIFSRRDGYSSYGHANGMRFFGHGPAGWWHIPNWWSGPRPGEFSLRIMEEGRIDVLSGGQTDAVGSAEKRMAIGPQRWQHVLYTYAGGTGRLYVDGRLVQSRDDIPYEAVPIPLYIGICGSWWMVWPTNECQSLDGSVRDLVWFDRALDPEEVATLVDAASPAALPTVVDADAIVVNGRAIDLARWSEVSAHDRRQALENLEPRDADDLRAMTDMLLPVLRQALADWHTRRAAAGLLSKLADERSHGILEVALPGLIADVANEEQPRAARAETALALSEMGPLARESLPVLADVLERIAEREGVRLPRIEDILRNAVMRALLDIDATDERARVVLDRVLAAPIMTSLDLNAPHLQALRPLVAAGRHLDALIAYRTYRTNEVTDLQDWRFWRTAHRGLDARLQHYRELPIHPEHDNDFLSQGNAFRNGRRGGDRAYTPVAPHEGNVYVVGIESISGEEYLEQVADLVTEHPGAKEWRDPDFPRLFRVVVARIDENGVELQRTFLEGPWFIFDGTDGKLRGWSIEVDRDGYIHLTGGKHTTPHPPSFIPGSWERMGASRNREDDTYPTMLYWVSETPGDIASLTYVGHRNHPRNVPVRSGMCYMNFARDRNRVIYLFGRVHDEFGNHSWGLYRYDPDARRWQTIGGYAVGIIEDAEKTHPEWRNFLIRNYRGGIRIPSEENTKTTVWSWQPHFYNFCRDEFGVQFDRTNRMHLRMQIRGLDENGNIFDSRVYAYSDDNGERFRRADGSDVELPLTTNPAPAHNADVRQHGTEQWWNLWHSLLREAGYRTAY